MAVSFNAHLLSKQKNDRKKVLNEINLLNMKNISDNIHFLMSSIKLMVELLQFPQTLTLTILTMCPLVTSFTMYFLVFW